MPAWSRAQSVMATITLRTPTLTLTRYLLKWRDCAERLQVTLTLTLTRYLRRRERKVHAQRLGRAVDCAEDVALDAAAQHGDDAAELGVVAHLRGCCYIHLRPRAPSLRHSYVAVFAKFDGG